MIFQSSWWTWPFMIRPIWYYNGRDLPAGMASTIVSLGNPAVWWMGIPAFFIALRAAWRGNKSLILLVTAIISQYIPWIFISRSAFIYHFFPMVPFLILTVVYLIKKWIEEGKSMKYVYGYLALVLVLFIMFYPAISGLIVPKAYIPLSEVVSFMVFLTNAPLVNGLTEYIKRNSFPFICQVIREGVCYLRLFMPICRNMI
ncbi:MAG: hypothetical protein ACOX22_01190 [Caldicoprobacterales bacterium]|jgi:dolichyl-phosphate-mannose-protein mannosyltransferase